MIVHAQIDSPQLARNLLEDPSDRDLFVYLPPGYEESDRRYPTTYLLHAAGETAAELVSPPNDGERWAPPLEDVLDPVFGRMGVPPMIVAIPDGTRDGDAGSGSTLRSPAASSRMWWRTLLPSLTAVIGPFQTHAVGACLDSLREGSARGTSPHVIPTCLERWRCSPPTRSWT
jgi:hypothetical protein